MIPNETDLIGFGILAYSLVGLAYSFFTATVWPCISYLVSSKTVGTAMGIAYCIQACGVSIGSFIVGFISSSNKTSGGKLVYKWIFWYLAGAASLATTAALILTILDHRKGGILFAKDPKETLKRLQEDNTKSD